MYATTWPFELPFGILLTVIIGKFNTWWYIIYVIYRPIILLLFCVCGRIRQVLWTHDFAWFFAALAIQCSWDVCSDSKWHFSMFPSLPCHFPGVDTDPSADEGEGDVANLSPEYVLHFSWISRNTYPESVVHNVPRHIDPNLSRVGCFSFCLAHVLEDV